MVGEWVKIPGKACGDRVLPWVWLAPAVAIGLGHGLTLEASPVLRMFAITGLLFFGMKVVVLYSAGVKGRPRGLNLGWFLFWPGMRPALFLAASKKNSVFVELKKEGVVYLGMGLGFLALAHAKLAFGLKAGLVMMGWSLVLHFGLFNLWASFYRSRGWRVRPVFFEPWKAENLGDFWSQRWNPAFSEMLGQAVYRPAVGRLGRSGAVMAVFAVSGFLHEAAITLPVQSGFGGPTLYFLLQGVLVLWEEAKAGTEGFGRARLFLGLLLPLPLLFPPAFIREVLLPMAGVIL